MTREVRTVATTTIHDVALHLRGIDHADAARAQAQEALRDLTGVVRMTVSGEVDPDVDLHRHLFDGIDGHLDGFLVRFGTIDVSYDLAELREERTVRGEFIRDVEASHLDDDTKRRVIVTGLRALDGRADLEVL